MTKINAETALLFQSRRIANELTTSAQQKLSSGLEINRPGDDKIVYSEAQEINHDKTVEQAKLEAGQVRLTWYQMSNEYLSSINEILSDMSTLALQASSSDMSSPDRSILDATFQKYKGEISQIVDGKGGGTQASGSFNTLPIFMGYSPPSSVGTDVTDSEVSLNSLNLFTGFNLDGFDSIDLLPTPNADSNSFPVPDTVKLTGTALNATANTITLDASRVAIDQVYKGMTISITGGTGFGQSATIIDYDGITGVATLDAPLPTSPDTTSTYEIDSGITNRTLFQIHPSVPRASFASHVWGADNAKPAEELSIFKPITQSEKDYRQLNSIPDTNLEAQTSNEKIERRKLNLFDQEFGNIATQERAKKMFDQILNALNRVTSYMAAQDGKAAQIQRNISRTLEKTDSQEGAVEDMMSVDFAKEATAYQMASNMNARFVEVAGKLNDTMSRLNDLARNKGKV
jgi:flagellin-like hook-associated protein FlgL